MTENNNNLRKEGEFESRVVKHRIPRRKKIKREKMDKRFANIKSSIKRFTCEVFRGYRAWLVTFVTGSLKVITIYLTAYLTFILILKMEPEQANIASIELVKQLKL